MFSLAFNAFSENTVVLHDGAEGAIVVDPGMSAPHEWAAFERELEQRGWTEALRAYVRADKPFLGICLGLQTLFEASEESPGVRGLGLLPGTIRRFAGEAGRSVPQIGWNTLRPQQSSGQGVNRGRTRFHSCTAHTPCPLKCRRIL